MKSFLKPLIFLAVLLGLAGIAYWDEWQTKKDEKEKIAQAKLLDFNPKDVQEVEYEKAGESGAEPVKLSLKKENGSWKIQSPIDYPAEAETIETWLKTLSDVSFEKSFEAAPERLKDFGLSPPKIRVSLTYADSKQSELRIGDKSPVGYSNYFQVEGKPSVYLVSQYVQTASNKELFDLRDKSLGVPEISKVQSLSFRYANGDDFLLERQANDWQVKGPKLQSFMADADEVASFFNFLRQQRIDRFLDDPSPDLHKALSTKNSETKSMVVIKIAAEGGSEGELHFFENNGIVYLKMPQLKDGFATVDKKVLEGIKRTPKSFQSRKMFSFNSTEATQAEIDGKKYEKKDEQWVESGSGQDRTEFVRLLLVDLEFAKAEEVLSKDSMAEVVKKEPLHSMKFTFKDAKTVDVALWDNADKPATVYLKRGDEGYFLAQAQILDHFKEQPRPMAKEKIGGEG